MNIEDKIDEYVNKVSMVGKKMEKNTFFGDKKQYYYKDKNDLKRILFSIYVDEDKRSIDDYADEIINLNKKGVTAYIGINPYAEDVGDSTVAMGVFDSKKELERQQHEAAQDI